MGRRAYIAIAVLLVALAGSVGWQAWRELESEPRYQGKPLSYWLEGAGQGYYSPSIPVAGGSMWTNAMTTTFSGVTSGPATGSLPGATIRPGVDLGQGAEAVSELGTNAIPTLLRMLRAKDSPLWSNLAVLLERLPMVKFRSTSAETVNQLGRGGFEFLGSEAKGAVPQLVEIYERNVSASSRNETALTLAEFGEDAEGAVPALIRGLSDKNPATFEVTVQALRRMNCKPQLMLPALVRCLDDTNGWKLTITARALAEFGHPRLALQALIRALSDKEPGDFARTAEAVRHLRPKPPVVMAAVAKCLEDANGWDRTAAVWVIYESSGDTHLTAPALVPLLDDPDDSVEDLAARMLWRIDPDTATKAGVGF